MISSPLAEPTAPLDSRSVTSQLDISSLKQLRATLVPRKPAQDGPTTPPPSDLLPLLSSLLTTTLTRSLPIPHLTLAVETLSTWLSRSGTDSALRAPLANTEATETILEVVQIHFDGASGGLAKALKGLLRDAVALGAEHGRLEGWAVRALRDVPASDHRKFAFYLLEVLVKRGLGAEYVLGQGKGEELIRDMIGYLEDRDLCPVIGKALVALLEVRKTEITKQEGSEEKWLKLWTKPVREGLMAEDLRWKVQTYVLPGLFKASTQSFVRFVEDLGMLRYSGKDAVAGKSSEAELGALLCCLKVGKDIGFVGEIDESLYSSKAILPLTSAFVAPLLSHSQPHIRLSALTLVSHSPTTTRLVPSAALSLLKSSLPLFHTETDAEERDTVIVAVRSLVARLAASSYAAETVLKNLLLKYRSGRAVSAADSVRREEVQRGIGESVEFVDWYLGFLLSLLRPGASYQLVSSALRVLAVLVRSGVDSAVAGRAYEAGLGAGSFVNGNGEQIRKGLFKWPESASTVSIFTPAMTAALLQLLFNPYDDIRGTARDILVFAPTWDTPRFRRFIERGIGSLNATGRARDADGVARTLELWFDIAPRGALMLEGKVMGLEVPKGELKVVYWTLEMIEREYLHVAEMDFTRAVKERPVHGLFAGLRLILERGDVYTHGSTEQWQDIHRRVFAACDKVWELSQSTLCVDSPEDYMPADLEGDEDDEDLDTQTVMSWSWRGIKDSSALLGTIIKSAPYSEDAASSTLPATAFTHAGQLLISQLASITHRGAFFSAAPSFLTLATRAFRLPAPISSLPPIWLSKNLSLLLTKSAAITRRSAGLPFLITSILAAEPDPTRPLLASTFARFEEIAALPVQQDAEKTDLPQVHALNCTRALFTTSALAVPSQAYVGRGLELAVQCFSSSAWPVRNCGVMLFTALTNRVFGVKRSRNDYSHTANVWSTRSFFDRYPVVRGVLLASLQENLDGLEQGGGRVEMVYPALSLLARLDHAADETGGMAPFIAAVDSCRRSRIWKVRVMAAQAAATLVGSTEWIDRVEALLDADLRSQNDLHGRLCAVRALLERRSTPGADWPRLLTAFAKAFPMLVLCNRCAVTKALFLDLLRAYTLRRLLATTQDVCPPLLERVLLYAAGKNEIEREVRTAGIVGKPMLKTALCAFTLVKILAAPTLSRAALAEYICLLESRDEELVLAALSCLRNEAPRLCLPEQVARNLDNSLWRLVAAPGTWSQIRAAALQLLHRLARSDLARDDLSARWSVAAALLAVPEVEGVKDAVLPVAAALAAGLWSAAPEHAATVLVHVDAAKQPEQPLETRLSALAALQALADVLVLAEGGGTEQAVPAFVALYDLLNDDDGDVRLPAAALACRLLPACPHVLHPLAAAARLCKALAEAFPRSAELRRAAVRRVTGAAAAPVGAVEARRGWQAANRREGGLFMRERQNLFLDRRLEVEEWAGVLARLEGAAEAEGLQEWVCEAERLLGDEEETEEEGWLWRWRVERIRGVVG